MTVSTLSPEDRFVISQPRGRRRYHSPGTAEHAPGQWSPHLTTIQPFAEQGHRELLRIAASLVWHLPDTFARAIVAAAQAAAIRPASTEGPHLWVRDQGIMTRVEDHVVALGRDEFLSGLQMSPPPAVLDSARRLTALGHHAFIVMGVTEQRCLGVLGIRPDGQSAAPDVN
jgi:cation transport ATPase